MRLFSSNIGECAIIFQWGVVIGSSLVAAVTDVRTRRIPNALTLLLLVGGLTVSTLRGGLAGLGEAAVACIMLAAPYVLLFLFAGGGAGDAKLMGAIGAWLGIRQSTLVLLCVVAAGVVLAFVKALSQRRLKFVLESVLLSLYSFIFCVAGGKRPDLHDARCETGDESSDELELPYGVAIAAGVCAAAAIVALWGTEWLWLWRNG